MFLRVLLRVSLGVFLQGVAMRCFYGVLPCVLQWAGSVGVQAAGAGAVDATMGVAVLLWALWGPMLVLWVFIWVQYLCWCVLLWVFWRTNAGAQRLKCKDFGGRAWVLGSSGAPEQERATGN